MRLVTFMTIAAAVLLPVVDLCHHFPVAVVDDCDIGVLGINLILLRSHLDIQAYDERRGSTASLL